MRIAGYIPKVDIYGTLTIMVQTQTYNQPLTSIIGTWRRFGLVGPVYQVISEGDALPNGDRLMRICIVETGEEVDYRLTSILDDPRER